MYEWVRAEHVCFSMSTIIVRATELTMLCVFVFGNPVLIVCNQYKITGLLSPVFGEKKIAHSLMITLSLSHTHTRTHARTHAHTHTHAGIHTNMPRCLPNKNCENRVIRHHMTINCTERHKQH